MYSLDLSNSLNHDHVCIIKHKNQSVPKRAYSVLADNNVGRTISI